MVAESHDALGRLKGVFEDSVEGDAIGGYHYCGPGRVAQRDLANDTRLRYFYDDLKRVTQTVSELTAAAPVTLDSRANGWDAVGNRTARRQFGRTSAHHHEEKTP